MQAQKALAPLTIAGIRPKDIIPTLINKPAKLCTPRLPITKSTISINASKIATNPGILQYEYIYFDKLPRESVEIII